MILKWMPWRFFVTRIARAYGFLDPIQLLSRLRGFSQPSEVSEPVELLRAGVLFHARGLINTKTIQNNLDWVWPYWVERQFNPADHSFIPRAFSFSHINLTHRNWTAVGLPDVPFYPLVDPRGLVTPLYDGWSLDFWLIDADGPRLLPSKIDACDQRYFLEGDRLQVITRVEDGAVALESKVFTVLAGQRPHMVVRLRAEAPPGTRLAVMVRPYNPEGISFVERIEVGEDNRHLLINGRNKVTFDRSPEKCLFSTYREGDVLHALPCGAPTESVECPAAIATGAALFSAEETRTRPLEVHVPILDELVLRRKPVYAGLPAWSDEVAQFSRCQVPDQHFKRLYEQAVLSLILHTPKEVYPGPYTYKRFWFRDAAFILNAALTLGAVERTRRALHLFPRRQTHSGYFLSQEGEWDSNGEAIWILDRFGQLTGEPLPEAWLKSIDRGARWIVRKRLRRDLPEAHAGLLPAGFSAEHLGPNDFYYWDNFWALAGLRRAACLLQTSRPEAAGEYRRVAEEYAETIVASFQRSPDWAKHGAIAASPHRRMDAGAIGSVVADYPLRLFPAGDPRILNTLEFLLARSSFEGGFFQNMIHSGINPYLTLHLAQVLLRAGDPRYMDLIGTVARLASSTGQWPEAVHPQTYGGCMGDGQHVWASAEWVLMMRNLFVREEDGALVIGSGIPEAWLGSGETIAFGPTLTPFGAVSVSLEPLAELRHRLRVEIKGLGGPSPNLEIRVTGRRICGQTEQTGEYLLERLL